METSNKVQEFAAKNGIMNCLHYAMAEELCVFERMAQDCGYIRKTTFFHDLSIAEWMGEESVRSTYNDVVRTWLGDVVYFTEFVLCLNWKIWSWHSRGNEELSLVYDELWSKADELAINTFKGDDLAYYYRTMD